MSLKGPTVKRILKEAAELSQNPSPDYHAAPLESDLYQWHFTLRGPSPPSPFSNGIYHGQISLPPSYPLKPPNFRFLTPSGRFEANREICLSISGHHEESWQPAWGIRTALVAIRAHMDAEAGGQLGGMSAAEGVRRRLAGESRTWVCKSCGRSNGDILKEQEELCKAEGEEKERARREKEEEEARGITFTPKGGDSGGSAADATSSVSALPPSSTSPKASVSDIPAATALDPPPAQQPTPTRTTNASTTNQSQPAPPRAQPLPPVAISRDVWLDRAIIGVFAALVFMVLRRLY